MVQEIMRLVIHDVTKDPAAKNSGRCVPIPVKDSMGEFVERCGQDDEEGRRHDKAILVHG